VFGSNEIDTSVLGTPMGNWPSGGCNISEFFAAQTLVLDITLCGGECARVLRCAVPGMTGADFAGSAQFFNQTCSGTCYLDYVINNGTSQYSNGYFEMGYVRVYSAQQNGSSDVQQPTSNGGGRSRVIAGGVVVFVALISLLLQ